MNVIHYKSVDSTNNAAKRLLRAGGLKCPACILADEQVAGRGTYGRSWISPLSAGIYMTVVIADVARPMPATPIYTLAASVACAQVLAEHAELSVRLKPVNDLYIGACKLGGILTEAQAVGSHLTGLMIGVGINFHDVPLSLGPDDARPTSLEAEVAPSVFAGLSRCELALNLARRIAVWTGIASSGGEDAVIERWQQYAGCQWPCESGVGRAAAGVLQYQP